MAGLVGGDRVGDGTVGVRRAACEAPAEGVHSGLFATTQEGQRIGECRRDIVGQCVGLERRVSGAARGEASPREADRARRGHGRFSSSLCFAGQWPSASITRFGMSASHSDCAKMLAFRYSLPPSMRQRFGAPGENLPLDIANAQ